MGLRITNLNPPFGEPPRAVSPLQGQGTFPTKLWVLELLHFKQPTTIPLEFLLLYRLIPALQRRRQDPIFFVLVLIYLRIHPRSALSISSFVLVCA